MADITIMAGCSNDTHIGFDETMPTWGEVNKFYDPSAVAGWVCESTGQKLAELPDHAFGTWRYTNPLDGASSLVLLSLIKIIDTKEEFAKEVGHGGPVMWECDLRLECQDILIARATIEQEVKEQNFSVIFGQPDHVE